ncbi:DUF3119 family protein [Leptolyngbya sp. PCC 6406]|uniref:DUF3119 family protein n=1 Tax=Leptolyngbya sp. PCC 6406 TaxID=1173264 RepID=UPI000486CB21|nr:DUF3119 family protein [Leptolyngbya sp. PCC 6406]
MTASPHQDSTDRDSPTTTTTLLPSYAIPIGLGLLAVPLLWVQLWLGGAIAVFALFLLYQTVTLRLVFTPIALEIYRGQTQIRQFPYQDWQLWELFWSPLPILFYFREVNSIHFLPILFQPAALRSELEARLPQAAADAQQPS